MLFAPTVTSGVEAAAKVIFSPFSVKVVEDADASVILPTVTAEATLTEYVPIAAEKSASDPETFGTTFPTQFAASFHDPPLVPFQMKVSACAAHHVIATAETATEKNAPKLRPHRIVLHLIIFTSSAFSFGSGLHMSALRSIVILLFSS